MVNGKISLLNFRIIIAIFCSLIRIYTVCQALLPSAVGRKSGCKPRCRWFDPRSGRILSWIFIEVLREECMKYNTVYFSCSSPLGPEVVEGRVYEI